MKLMPYLVRLSGRLVVALSMVWVSGCHSVNGTVSHDPVGHFSIIGYQWRRQTIDGGAPIQLQSDSPITVAPGRHRVQISRGGSVVMDRDVMVSDLQTLELSLP